MFGRTKSEVLVVGAGPVGLFAALSLVKRGIKPRIIEESRRSGTRSFALALHGDSLELLDRVGLASVVLEDARRIERIGLYDRTERRAQIDLTTQDTKYPFVAVLPQSSLERLLTAALEAEGVKVEWNHRLARFMEGDESVSATIHKLGKESVGYAMAQSSMIVSKSRDIEVPLILAADGHNSLVRRQARVPFETVKPAQHYAVFEFTPDREVPDEARLIVGDGTINLYWPMPGNRCRWSFQTDEAGPGENRWKDRMLVQIEAQGFPLLDPDELDGFIEERAPWFDGRPVDMHWCLAVCFEHRLASRFGEGSRIWLAGDAAHLTAPGGNQSMNVGLREAADLAEAYADVLEGRQTLDSLASYGGARLNEWRFLLGLDSDPKEPPEGTWVTKRDLVSSIPASGATLHRILEQLDLPSG